MNRHSLCSGLLLLALSASAAVAEPQQIGSALVVVNLVTAEFNRDTRTLQSGDDVNQNELIEVGLDGSSELKLNDDTKLALGPGSHLKLDKFVYDPSKTSGSIVLELVKGTFRFVTGVAEKPTYVIKTPSAAITVRGTIFDVFVEQSGASWLLLLEGGVQVCNVRGQCRVLDEPGKMIRIDDGGDVGPPVKWASLSDNDGTPPPSFDDAFPFVVKTPSFDPNPPLTREVILGPGPAKPPRKPDYKEPERKADTVKPTKKRQKQTYEPRKPKKKYVKKRDNDDAVMKGVGTAIGIGIGIGIGKNRGGHGGGMGGGGHKPGGGYPGRGTGGMMPR